MIVVDGGDLRLRALNANPATSTLTLWPWNTQIRSVSSARLQRVRDLPLLFLKHCGSEPRFKGGGALQQVLSDWLPETRVARPQ